MKRKRGPAKLGIILIMVAVVAVGVAAYNFYFNEPTPTTLPAHSSSGPSVPSRCSLVAQNDTYVKPDFDRLKAVMQNQPIVLDVPEKGKISLRFFHFTEGCRIYDKSYILSNGQIIESGGSADIYVTLASSYVDKIDETNFCDIVKEARANDDLGQWINEDIGEATLLWRYKSMLKYKECLGLQISE